MIPVTPMSGIDSGLFADAKEIGLEKHISKIKKLISMKSDDEFPPFSKKIVDDAIKSRQTVSVKVGPNNVHDILDSLD